MVNGARSGIGQHALQLAGSGYQHDSGIVTAPLPPMEDCYVKAQTLKTRLVIYNPVSVCIYVSVTYAFAVC